jgi:predicted DCC family thiol-disulfide oxidoreductase YuxK
VQSAIRISSPPNKPVLIFDGDCGFCRNWIMRWDRATAGSIEFLPYQAAELPTRFPELLRTDCAAAVHLISTDGAVCSGAEAVFLALSANPRHAWPLWLYRNLGLFDHCSEWVYGVVANHRQFFSVLTRFLLGGRTEPSSHLVVRSVFLRSIGAVYLFAFLSLWFQIHGLVGSNGILPAQATMDAVARQSAERGIGVDRFHLAPTLCWISASDHSLSILCASGSFIGLALIGGLAPTACLVLLWLLYLSLATVCREFLGFQWDNLLLETGFLAIFLAPCRLRMNSDRAAAPSRIVIWLLRWLLFRLMFESGVVKLSSQDPAWSNLTALQYHFETQPLPTWIGWLFAQLPLLFQEVSVVIMFFIELALPFFVFVPGRARRFACFIFIAFQILIFLTGNYCFFNLLTIALCLLLLDDSDLSRIIPWRWRATDALMKHVPASAWRQAVTLPLASIVMVTSVMQFSGTFRRPVEWPRWMLSSYRWLSPFRSFNSYGLFSIMTTARREIVIEGSNDGISWKSYEFRYKPGALKKRPGFVEPHQPRLDWQMWFAALGSYQQNPWFLSFCLKILQGSPQVLSLLDKNPFPGKPPRYLRAVSYQYHFTNIRTLYSTGAWWKRQPDEDYLPMISLENRR